MKTNERLTAPINQKLADAMMAVLKVIHDPSHTGQIEPELLERQRRNQDILGKMVTPPLGFSWEPFDLNGLPMAWVRPERATIPAGSSSTATAAATPPETWAMPGCWRPKWPASPAARC